MIIIISMIIIINVICVVAPAKDQVRSCIPGTRVEIESEYSRAPGIPDVRANMKLALLTPFFYFIHATIASASDCLIVAACNAALQRGFCRQEHRHRNTDPKIGPGG